MEPINAGIPHANDNIHMNTAVVIVMQVARFPPPPENISRMVVTKMKECKNLCSVQRNERNGYEMFIFLFFFLNKDKLGIFLSSHIYTHICQHFF